jgi:DHA1 family bicyclomycin/chloramphenicol resistance-like MFS transporter
MSSTSNKVPTLILFFLFALSQSTESTYTTALPEISLELSIHPSVVQFSSSVYFYGFALGIFILGRISDLVGRKPVVIFGLSLFLICCLLSFFVKDINSLIILRFIKAFGASVGSVVAQAMARDSYKGDELSKLYAALAAGLAFMPALSSFIGGNIVKFLGWRYLFIYLFFAISIVLLFCIFKLKETRNCTINNQESTYTKVFLVLIRDRKVLCYGAIIGAFNGIMYSFYIEAPFIFMTRLSIDPSGYGAIILCLGVSSIIGGLASRTLQIKGVDGKRIIKGGLVLSGVSCFFFFILGVLWDREVLEHYHMKYLLIIPMMTQTISFSAAMPNVLRYSLEDYSKVNGTAGSIVGTYYYLIIATVNFLTSRLHSEDIIKISLFFLFLSISSSILFYISSKAKIIDNYNYKL